MLVRVRKAEIDQFKSFVKVDEEVLRLEISMNDSNLVEMLDSVDQLAKILACFCLFESLFLENELEKLAF